MEEENAVAVAVAPAASPVVTKKRAAAECHDTDTTTTTTTDNNASCHVEEPCSKKPKLSKKELLEAAKARLKEAQEKKKLLQAKLLEEEERAQQQQQQLQQVDVYQDYDDYYYQYEYHIPPVTGSRESLLMTQIESTGPIDKVRFIQDRQSCITSVCRTIAERKRSATISPIHAAAASSVATKGPPLPPPQQDNMKSVSMTSETSANSTSKPLALNEGLKSQRPTNYKSNISSTSSANIPINNIGAGRRDHPPPRGQPNNGHHHGPPPLPSPRQAQHAIPHHPPAPLPQQQQRSPPTNIRQHHQGPNSNINNNRPSPPNNSNRNAHPDKLKPSSGPIPPKVAPPRRTSSSGSNSQSNPKVSNQNNTNGRAGPGPPSIQNNNSKRPWKLALAQITAKTLDYTGELPTKTGYMIRTQDQGVVAHVQFFAMPPNPTLLEHLPSKRHLHEHLEGLPKLPVSKTASWKGQELLTFLKNQDGGTNAASAGGRKTYQPPARRNLPCTYWALLDLESPLLQTVDSVGYFTAVPAAAAAKNVNTKSNATTTVANKTEISFAGKLVWNMNDFYQQQQQPNDRNNNNNANTSGNCKLSKWGEVVSAVATSGIRNAPLIATIQGFYEIHNANSNNGPPPPMPPKLRARKVILPKSRTIGIIIGCHPSSSSTMEPQNHDNNTNGAPPVIMGCCQVLFPNGMASGPSSAQSLKGARAILYD